MNRILLALLFVSLSIPASGDQWKTAPVPGAQKIEGFAWYRSWFMPTKHFFLKHDRDLFRESVSITVRGLSGAHEVYVNGQKIGLGGKMPPQYEDGAQLNLRHKIPPGLVREGLWNEIAFRVYHPGGNAGFTSEEPIVVTYFTECRMAGPWEFRKGDPPLNSPGPLTEKPTTSAFDNFQLATTALGEAPSFTKGPKLTPEESAKLFTTADDLSIEQLLHEPHVAQPTHFNFDERGRIWVAHYRQYPYPAGLKVLSRDQYYRSVFDKVPPPPPHHAPGRDVISVHEDTDGDGFYDKHKIFLDDLNMANSALPTRGGVWVMHTPYLLFYPDTDGDDIPDGDPVVHLSGFGLEDTHAVANSLTFGPDGWIYGAQGSSTSSHVTRPGKDESDAAGVYFEGPMVWRYHPVTREYEIFAEGGGNVFGLEFDNLGRLFSGTNGGNSRGYHYVQGGTCGVEAANQGKYGPSPHPYNFGVLLKMPSEQAVPRFSHIAAVVEGTALPENYRGHFFSVDPLHSNVIDSIRKPLGSSFGTADLGDVVKSADEAFRPVFIANAPDGSLFIADFYNHYIAHGQHYQSQIDHTTGRIYRLRGKDSVLEKDLDLASKSDEELIALLSHPNKWHRRMAVRLIGDRKHAPSAGKLKDLLTTETGQTALEALWALHQGTGLDGRSQVVGLGHPNPAVRSWTVRLLGDSKSIPGDILPQLIELAANDKDVEVRAQLACTARRLPADQALPIIQSLMLRTEDASDPYIPLLVWWALEEKINDAPDRVVSLFENPQTRDAPLVQNTILPRLMRRLAVTGKQSGLLACAKLLQAAPTREHAQRLLTGLNEAYRGRAMNGLPDELLSAMAKFGKAPLLMRLRQGDRDALEASLQLVADKKAEETERLSLIRALGELRSEMAQPVLLQLALKNPPQPIPIRKAALAALGNYRDPKIGEEVLANLSAMDPQTQSAALALLASRSSFSDQLLQAIEKGQLSSTLITPDVADRFRLHQDEAIQKRARKLFPMPTTASDQFSKAIRKVELSLESGLGNAYEGEKIFGTRCAACHRLFFKGGTLGPDLTSYQRDNLGTMLISIVNPNAEIREGFEYQMLVTKDGRSIGGFLVENDPRVVVLRGLDGQELTVKQDEIQEVKSMGRSLMPDGLLNDLTEGEVRDLFAFLRLSQPISR